MATNTSQRRSAAVVVAGAAAGKRLSSYDVVIGLAAVLSLVVLALILFVPLPPSARDVLTNLEDGLCALFLFDFCRSLRRAPRKWGYFVRGGGWLDLLGSAPFSAFAVFRIFRLFRVVRVLRALRGSDFRSALAGRLAKSTLLSTLFIALVLIFAMGAVVALAEQGAPRATIETYPEAVWWAVVTVATVGYGDYYPVTTVGRLAAVVLMFAGLGIIGVLSSYLATTFISLQAKGRASGGTGLADQEGRAGADNAKGETGVAGGDAELVAIKEELAANREELAALRRLLEERPRVR